MGYPEPAGLPEPCDKGLTCQQVIALLVDYVAGTLQEQVARALHAHLHDCAACVAFLRTYEATIRATRTLREEDMPAELPQRVWHFLRGAMTPPASGRCNSPSW